MAESKEYTLAQAAKLVGRKESDCINFKDYGDWVIVITLDGQKLRAEKNAKA
jgi:hypothetical protein